MLALTFAHRLEPFLPLLETDRFGITKSFELTLVKDELLDIVAGVLDIEDMLCDSSPNTTCPNDTACLFIVEDFDRLLPNSLPPKKLVFRFLDFLLRPNAIDRVDPNGSKQVLS